MRVFDADAHWIEKEHELLQRAGLNRPRAIPRDGWDRTALGKYREVDASLEQRLAFMDTNGIECAVVHPTRCLSLGLMTERDVAVSVAEAFNEYALEQCRLVPTGRLYPVALAVPQCIEHSTKMIKEYKDSGFAAVMIPPHGHQKLLGEDEFRSFYEACIEADLAVTLHPNSFGVPGTDGFSIFAEVHCLSFPLALIRQFISMALHGIFEQYPTLRVCFLEAGVSWLPYWLHRLDSEFDKRQAELSITMRPSEAVARASVYISCSEPEPLIPEVNRAIGGGVVWISDFPHWDTSTGEDIEALAKILPKTLLEEILWTNSLSCFGIERA